MSTPTQQPLSSSGHMPSIPFADVHWGGHTLLLACWTLLIGAFWVGFGTELSSQFMVAISTVYMLMFFGTPLLIVRISQKAAWHRKHRETFATFLSKPFDTCTGALTGREALLQMALVPAGLIFGIAGIGYAVHAARQAAGG